jgi:hypothetical protein
LHRPFFAPETVLHQSGGAGCVVNELCQGRYGGVAQPMVVVGSERDEVLGPFADEVRGQGVASP